MEIFWLVLVIVFAGLEIITLDLSSIWFAVGSLVAMISAPFIDSILVQTVFFALGSGLCMIYFKPILKKKLFKDQIKTNIDSIIGTTGVVTQNVTNQAGEVKVSGKFWSARTTENIEISVGQTVKILEITGVKLIVEKE